MRVNLRQSAIALALIAAPGLVHAQAVITRDPVQPLQLTPDQRATIYRTIVPQGRGRSPIVRERIVIEPVAPTVRERVVTRPAQPYGYSYDADAYAYAAPSPRVVVTPDAYGDYAYVGARVPSEVRLSPFPRHRRHGCSGLAQLPVRDLRQSRAGRRSVDEHGDG